MRNSNSSSNNNTNNSRYVTTTTVREANNVPRVEKVVYDNRIKRKNVLALNEKVAAIREYEKRPIYKRIGRMFQCSADQIKRIVQQKESILNAWEQRTRKCRDAKTLEMKVVRVSMLGKAVYEWIRRMLYYKDILITDGLIQKMALQFKSAMGLQNFFPHQEWCDKFRSTYKIYTCDSKTLNIAYNQGHSVQIKDVMKDVLSECCPNEEGNEDHYTDGDDLDDDCMSIDSDEEDDGTSQNNNCTRDKSKSKLLTKDKSKTVVYPKPTTIQTMQGLRQLVALPLQGNGLQGMGQKVLVATPIVQPGQKQGSGPMTMTIIPLATLGQAQNNINATSAIAGVLNPGSFTQTCPSRNDNNNNDDITIPNPLIEIKQEIKEEPKDEVENMPKNEGEDTIRIKKEYITDDEEDCSQTNKQTTAAISNLPSLLPAHVVSIPISNRDILEESSKDSMDDLTLSSLRKRIKIEENSAEQQERKSQTRNKSSEENNVESSYSETRSVPNMPPMPPLTKAPTLNITSTAPTATSSTANCYTIHTTNKSDTLKSQNSTDLYSNSEELPAIRTCSEARKYLKLLEDFALERENFRLIGLITRADEVLRELDRKENSEGDNEDVDID